MSDGFRWLKCSLICFNTGKSCHLQVCWKILTSYVTGVIVMSQEGKNIKAQMYYTYIQQISSHLPDFHTSLYVPQVTTCN